MKDGRKEDLFLLVWNLSLLAAVVSWAVYLFADLYGG